MEQQTEVVAAAEAVRSWILAQRASWAGDEPLPHVVGESSAAPSVLPIVTASAAFIDAEPEPVDEPSSLPEPPSLAPFLRIPDPITSVYVESPRRLLTSRLLARVAVLLAAAGIIGGGGYAGWKRYAAMPRTGTAVIASTPAGAQVLVDGNPAGTTPLRIDLASGRHQLEFRLKGESQTRQVEIVRGSETPVTLDWSARRTGTLQVSSTPEGARVLVDGRDRGVTPLQLTDIPAGGHQVRIESAEGSVSRRVEVLAGRTELLNESIYAGWIHVSAPFDVVVVDGNTGVQLDRRNRALMKPGPHALRIENRALGFVESRQISVEPGGTTEVDIASPTSTLTVTGPAGAEVFVDGEKIGTVPLAAYPVKLGTRDVMVTEPSGATHHRSLTITATPVTIDIAMP